MAFSIDVSAAPMLPLVAGDTGATPGSHEPADDRRRRALIDLRHGRMPETMAAIRDELRHGADSVRWLSAAINEAMAAPDLSVAGVLAGELAAFQHGIAPHPGNAASERMLTLPKLRHDIAQYRYLREQGVLDATFDATIAAHEAVAERHQALGDNARAPLSHQDLAAIGDSYCRIVHLADAGRTEAPALSASWNRDVAQRAYLDHRPGVVVIDDFLSEEALARLNRFCLRSTCWFGNRYANGRLGAFLFSGFNAPLLLQIAEEIRDALPEVIDDRHPLRQLWAFKNTGELPADSTIHADFAAINVNFWITPEDANADPDSGGMVIYDIDAPASWDFATYNERIDIIREYLAVRQPRVIRVPYRQNRAVIFNSDLFHATEAVRFHPGYINHRINVTMLYGDRNDDQHHPPAEDSAAAGTPSWRSAAFSRSRR
ncbi:MAG: hypothetical protein Q8M57_05210 [Nitrosomonas sp.]|uniref:hypothetical protein n=1 Tax=Nitrosomonas sp. TaxID=42353 RepID=UPI0027330C09|nr:hypothetical protein [Nitrosomonas sp.]MDP3280436.1 hypothetical protein [Nitrosomonas sp.]